MNSIMEDVKVVKVRRGSIVDGTVFHVGEKEVLLDLGAPYEARLYLNHLTLDKDVKSCKELVKEGDILSVKVTQVDHENQYILVSKLEMIRRELELEFLQSIKEGDIISVFVKKVTRNRKTNMVSGLALDYNGNELFCPRSHIDPSFDFDPESLVKQNIEVKILEIDGSKVTVSRKKLIFAEQKAAKKEALDAIEVDSVLSGVVEDIKPYGAFISLGEVNGLVHRSEISHYGFRRIEELLEVGQEVEVKVLSKEGNKIALSMKALTKEPWSDFATRYKASDKVEGTIVKKLDNAMIIEIERQVSGLLKKMDYSWDPNYNLAGDVEEGDKIEVQILSINVDNKRMALSKKHLDYNPWKDVHVKVNEEIAVTVKELLDRGAVVQYGEVEGFLPIGEVKEERVEDIKSVLNIDDVLNVVVTKFDKRNWKLVVSIKQLEQRKQQAVMDEYYKSEQEEVKEQTLGDLFADEFDKFDK